MALSIKKSSIGLHALAGIITLLLVAIVGGLGLTRIMMPRCCDIRWKTHKLLRIKKLHQYLAYLLILGSQATITLGVKSYVAPYDNKNRDYFFIGTSNVIFLAILILSEIIYRARFRNEVTLGGDMELESISRADFSEMVYQ